MKNDYNKIFFLNFRQQLYIINIIFQSEGNNSDNNDI